MDSPATRRSFSAEFLGTAFLLVSVVGSGIMAERLAGGNVALALLANSIATGAMLVVLISLLGPISGGHFNPAVTLGFTLRKEISTGLATTYIAAQISGALVGTWAAHVMFDETVIQLAETDRTGLGQWFSEALATFGLLLTILGALRVRPEAIPVLVGLYITAAYWFAASTSFANPAVTIARGFTDSFSGITPTHVLPFVLAQLVGAGLAVPLASWLFRRSPSSAAG